MPKFQVVGMGPGSSEYVLLSALKAVEQAEVLLGSSGLVKRWSGLNKNQDKIILEGSVDKLLDQLESIRDKKKCALLVSGDPGFYSLLGAVTRRFKPDDYQVVPGITSFQAAAAQLGLNWQNFDLVSVHGRKLYELAEEPPENRGLVILTDNKNTPSLVGKFLTERGWNDRGGWLCSNVSLPDESYVKINLGNIPDVEDGCLCLLILLPASAE